MAKVNRRRSISSRRQASRRQSTGASNRRTEAGAAVIMVAGAFAIVGILLNAGYSYSDMSGLKSQNINDNNIQGLATAYEVGLAAEAYSQNTGVYFDDAAMQCLEEKCSNEESAINCVANYAEFCTI